MLKSNTAQKVQVSGQANNIITALLIKSYLCSVLIIYWYATWSPKIFHFKKKEAITNYNNLQGSYLIWSWSSKSICQHNLQNTHTNSDAANLLTLIGLMPKYSTQTDYYSPLRNFRYYIERIYSTHPYRGLGLYGLGLKHWVPTSTVWKRRIIEPAVGILLLWKLYTLNCSYTDKDPSLQSTFLRKVVAYSHAYGTESKDCTFQLSFVSTENHQICISCR